MRGLLLSALVSFFGAMHPGAVSAAIGAPRTGKTTAVQMAYRAGALGPRLVVFDPYARRDRMELRRGEPVSPWPGVLITPTDLAANVRELDRPRSTLVVCPEGMPSEQELGDEFSRVAELCWHTGRLDLVAEEIGKYGRAGAEWVNTVASGGGHAGIRLHTICQSFGRIQKDARRNVTHLIVFAQGDESDLLTLRQRCGRDFERRVRELHPRDGDTPASPPILWRLGGAASRSVQ